ncbi:MAG: DNA gyrase subunit A [Myxococcota bacterium]
MTDVVPPPENGGPGGPTGNHQPINIEDEMRQSYLDYAMSVIIGRALPDVRDGLKPVHRRVLYAMHELSNTFNRPYKKSARVVGDVVGKYHPHGESAIYEALVRLAQDFSMRHILVDGQGNFGSVDGDPPAAMRYTEVRMTRLAGEMLADIDKETVDFVPNYDAQDQEPSVLPTRFPNLLVNGSAGIAVGMATNIPPHNLGEVIDATIALARDPSLGVDDLMKIVPAPDFPTAGIIYGTSQLRQAYATGRGVIKIRGKARVEEWKNDRERIIIDELPYQVNKAALIERIADHIRDKRIEGISDIRDESSREGMRVVIELRRDVSGDIILNQLYRNTALQSSFGINMVAIVQGRPRILGLKDILENFVDHRREIVTRRSRFELREAEKRFNVVFGLLSAIDSIDRVIEIIRAAPDPKVAKANLMNENLPMSAPFRTFCERLVTFDYEVGRQALEQGYVKLNEAQAQAILDMRLARLTGLAREELEGEADELRDVIEKLLEILGSEARLLEVIIEELQEIRERYANERRTAITHDAREMSAEDLIADEEMVVTVSHNGYVKRNPTTMYRAQRRGGRGKTAASTRDEDFVENIFVASTHSYVLVFTDKGRVYWLKVHEIPQASRAARGKPIINLIRIQSDEKIAAVMPVRSFEDGVFVAFVTSKGYIKKTELKAFASPRPSGLIALSIDEGDELIRAAAISPESELLVATRMGMAIRFKESDARPMGRNARGVRALNLKKDGDAVVGMAILDDESLEILTLSEKGYGKRTPLAEYRVQGRGGSGIINMKISDRTGEVSSARAVLPDDEIMVVTNRGMMIRTRVDQISSLGRSTQGVRIINMRDDEERVASVERIAEKDDED